MRRQTKLSSVRVDKKCLVCGRTMNVILYQDGKYRGGHYFGKLPLFRKKEWKASLAAGTKKSRLGDIVVNVLKKDPKPYKHVEYWECPKCFRS